MKAICLISGLLLAVSIIVAPIIYHEYQFQECVDIKMQSSRYFSPEQFEKHPDDYRLLAEGQCNTQLNN